MTSAGKKIRALVVDDEMHAREEICALLEENGLVEVIGACANAIEALKEIHHSRPDVIFLDIQMPAVDGFELLNMVNEEIMPHVVFVTAFDQYTLKAFEEKTLDYLLKPVEPGRLGKTIAKLQRTLAERPPAFFEPRQIQRIPCLLGNRVRLIPLQDVEYVGTGQAGVHVTIPEGEFYTDVTLKVLEERTSLLRCHKQYLANIDCIKEIVLLEGGVARIETRSGNTIPVSRRYLKRIRKVLLL